MNATETAFAEFDNNELDSLALGIDAGQGEKMAQSVFDFIGRFVCYPSKSAQIAHTLWILHAHLMDKWESTPRMAFLSQEPASGKSRALEVTEPLVPRPMEAVNVSPSALFRSIGNEDGLPTILFDEIDTIFGAKAKEHEELRGLLNAGHRRGAKTYRSVVRGKAIEVEAIEAYSAVALAGLGFLPDTLLSRSIVIRMRRRHAGEQVEPYRRRLHHPAGEAIRHQIETWAASVADQIEWPELPPEIQDRNADVWEPLISIADAIGGEWPARARAAAVTLVSEVSDLEPSLGVRLLSDVKTVFGNQERMTSKSLIASLIALEEAPWHDLRGKPIDERSLAHRLKGYGIRSISIRIGEATSKGYRASDFYDAWQRYIPPVSGNCVTSDTPAQLA